MKIRPIVFVRVDWMNFYQQSCTVEPKSIGGGKYTRNNTGLESDNFLADANGIVHGYFAVGHGKQNITL